MRHSAYKRENYTFINPNIQVINTICKVNRPLCVVGRLGRVKKRKRAEDDGRLFSLFPSSLARLLFFDYCYFYWSAQRELVRRREVQTNDVCYAIIKSGFLFWMPE